MHTCVYITKAPSHQKTTSFTQILTASVWVKADNLRWRKNHFGKLPRCVTAVTELQDPL